MIKLTIDGGGGFLKPCLSIFDTNDPCSKCSSGLTKFLESSVKRVFIIDFVPDVPELYVNVKRIRINCGINHLKEYTVATDLKLYITWNDEPQLLHPVHGVILQKIILIREAPNATLPT